MKLIFNSARFLSIISFIFVFRVFPDENGARLFSLIETGEIEKARKSAFEAYNTGKPSAESLLAYALLCEDAEKAAAVFREIADNGTMGNLIRIEALVRLSELFGLKEEYDESYDYLRRAVNLEPDESLLYRKALAALQCGKTDSAENVISLLKNDSLRNIAVSHYEKYNKAGANTGTSSAGPLYSLQTGAFSDRENADIKATELRRKYPDVDVVEGRRRGRNLYKVIIGAFGSKEEARLFGEQKLESNFFIIKRPDKI